MQHMTEYAPCSETLCFAVMKCIVKRLKIEGAGGAFARSYWERPPALLLKG